MLGTGFYTDDIDNTISQMEEKSTAAVLSSIMQWALSALLSSLQWPSLQH
ncbi:hypothetical protein JCM19233_4542 [Vibrio astriarenae]|nr:hypothetical protein JCM19233_4542 [Vibrio sp. C7]